MSENYLDTIEIRLRTMFEHVANGTESVDDAVSFIKDEILASWKRGRESGRLRKTTPRKGRRFNNSKSTTR